MMQSDRLGGELREQCGIGDARVSSPHPDEVYLRVGAGEFGAACLALHKKLHSPVMTYFAADEREARGAFALHCAFLSRERASWCFVSTEVPGANPRVVSIAREIYSSSLFEREIAEMFGIEFPGNPDLRRLRLHDEVWPEGAYPLRKDFRPPAPGAGTGGAYRFKEVEGEGIFDVPVGPVHAGIIGPGHFRFNVAGEPITNLQARLGFTHRGVEKLFEGTSPDDAVALAERVAGDSSFAHGAAFCGAAEKLRGLEAPERAHVIRAVFLELERMYNHAADAGGIATDVGFGYPAALASVIKEELLALNGRLTGSRYLRGVNAVGGVRADLDEEKGRDVLASLDAVEKDFRALKGMLFSNISFMDRVDRTGVLHRNTAADLGIVGPAARASGIPLDLREIFPGVYGRVGFNVVMREEGDVLARLNVRVGEFEESARMVRAFLAAMPRGEILAPDAGAARGGGSGIGCVEGWRGPVLYWVALGAGGAIERCKVTDPSFHNWPGLTYAVLGNIIPDFPLCNKSFNLSYSGNDL
jgi:Ni,Fe-hydrogenase III large subunit/Ni,Fe-hydrogenase III component G